MLSCPEHLHRGNWFTGDPEFEDMTGEPNNYFNDYRHSGYDKGHNMSAADNACDAEGMRECFYFSNMTPQPHSFNAGVWEDLEKLERAAAIDLDTLIISVGSIGISAYIGEDSVVLPKYMWKVIYTKKLNHYEAFIFPDADNDDAPLGNYHTTLQAIEEQAHLKFSNGFAYLLN
jgi:endonuclease G